jgi:hypothetical protein
MAFIFPISWAQSAFCSPSVCGPLLFWMAPLEWWSESFADFLSAVRGRDPHEIPAQRVRDITMLALTFAAMYPLYLSTRTDQRARNASAGAAMQALRNGKKPGRPILLYLRSFNLDDRFGQKRFGDAVRRNFWFRLLPDFAPQKLALDIASKDTRLEGFLQRIVQKHPARPIGCSLGRAVSATGFGRISTTDARWQDDVRLLLRDADCVLMLYAETVGTSWELDLILEPDIVRKTVFIFPPTSHVRSQSDLDRYEVERGYLAFAEILKQAGYSSPPFQQDKAFTLDPETKAVRVIDLGYERFNFEPMQELLRSMWIARSVNRQPIGG